MAEKPKVIEEEQPFPFDVDDFKDEIFDLTLGKMALRKENKRLTQENANLVKALDKGDK